MSNFNRGGEIPKDKQPIHNTGTSGIRLRTSEDALDAEEVIPNSRVEHIPPANETISNIYKNIGEERVKITQVLEKHDPKMVSWMKKNNPEMISWWESNDPLVVVYGQLVTVRVLSDLEFKMKIFELFPEYDDALFFYRMPNTDQKKSFLKSKFPHVNFDTLLMKKAGPEIDYED